MAQTMTREDAIAAVRSRIDCREYLTKSKSGNYDCPFCGSGTGANHTGALKLYPSNTFTCFACRKSGDVLDLIQNAEQTDFNGALMIACERLSITIIAAAGYHAPRNTAAADFSEAAAAEEGARARENTPAPAEAAEGGKEAEIEQPADYRDYYIECCKRLNDPAAVSYLAGRGISYETARAAYIGYDPAADPASAPGGSGEIKHPCPRIIIPTTAGHYVGRSIDPQTADGFKKMNNKGGKPGIMNQRALYADNETVFVVEGAFDALSLMEVGAAAVALNSTSNADKMIKTLEAKPTAATLILCLDNDEAGKKAASVLRDGLQRLNISYISANICGAHKDPNEALTADRKAFEAAVRKAQAQTAARPDNVSSYIENLMTGDIDSFKEARNRRTGFAKLDEQAGGLYAGLYCIAAISSLGKTTFAHQIADQLAAAGNDVLFFSMEQSRLELVSKSIARRTAQKDRQAGREDMPNAVTSLSIRRGNLPESVLIAADEYRESIGDRLSIIEGNFNCDISFIGEYVRQYIRRTGSKPIVFIDYLQILQTSDERAARRDVIDTAVTELKRISREHGLTIFVISSVNRSNYLTPIDFESLKESGGIEYTCDVIWGLQLQCLNDPVFDSKEKVKEKRQKVRDAKAANPRKIELLCLKNRYGIANFSSYFDYYPKHDLYVEGISEDEFLPAHGKTGTRR